MKFGRNPIKNDLVRVTTTAYRQMDRQTDGQAENNRALQLVGWALKMSENYPYLEISTSKIFTTVGKMLQVYILAHGNLLGQSIKYLESFLLSKIRK